MGYLNLENYTYKKDDRIKYMVNQRKLKNKINKISKIKHPVNDNFSYLGEIKNMIKSEIKLIKTEIKNINNGKIKKLLRFKRSS
ncbi:hypothetical protein ACFL1H_00530 [Nanoarchaeota archaeon]